jgi:hypothetical protein
MDAPEQVADAELLYTLRKDYVLALQQEDYGRINRFIVPRFLERFGKYYEEYARDWKSRSLYHLPVRVVIDPRQREEMQIEWADQVLKGQIELDV